MAGNLDSASIDIPCPKCGHKNPKTVGWLRTQKQFTCRCGTRIELESSNFRKGISDVEAGLKDLTDSFKKLGR